MSIHGILAARAAAAPAAVAIRCVDGSAISYCELQSRIVRAAHQLVELGVERGDRVALLGRNDPSQLILLAACSAGGVVASFLNWRLTMKELAPVVADASPVVLFAGHSAQAAAQDLGARMSELTVVQSSSEDLLDVRARRPVVTTSQLRAKSADGDLLLCFTSGSSGCPKAVRLTHDNLQAAAAQALAQPDWGWSESAVSLCALPLFHIAGLRAALFPLLFGGTTVFPADAQPYTILRSLVEHRVSKLSIVPTLLASVVREPSFETADLTGLATVFYGGAPMPESLLLEVTGKLRCDLVQIYGLTETTGAALALGPGDHVPGSARRKSCGTPLPGLELRLGDGAATSGEDAEVLLRGPTICSGYWNRGAENVACFSDGWFHTGDLGSLDASGYLYLRGRIGDIIKSGGEKVVPSEVEEVLLQHPAVRDAGVVGLPDAKWGERVAAAVVLRDRAGVTDSDLLNHCRQALAGYKLPKQLTMVEALPRNANGKLVRSDLRVLLSTKGSQPRMPPPGPGDRHPVPARGLPGSPAGDRIAVQAHPACGQESTSAHGPPDPSSAE